MSVAPTREDDRFTHLCAELTAAVQGERGTIAPRHLLELRDHILPRIVTIRDQINRHRTRAHVERGEINQLWELFTDITGIDETT